VSRIRVPIVIAVALLVALVVVGMVTGSTASPPTVPVVTTAPVTAATLVCPHISDVPSGTTSRATVADVAGALSPPSASTGTVTATVLAGRKSKTTSIHLSPTAVLPGIAKTSQTIALSAHGSVAATMAADQVTEDPTGRDRQLSGVRCEAPAIDWWFAGADGRVGYSDTLVLANPAATPASVVVSLWGSKGSLLATRLQSLRVAPRSSVDLSIAANAPDAARIAVHVHAASGAVTAALFDQRTAALKSDGGDFVPATNAPSRALVVAGFAAGKGPRQLVIANPGIADATVGLRVVTPSGSFTPSGDNQIVVRARHTGVVDLDRAFAGTTGAVSLTSDQPVVAQGLSITPEPPHRPDLMWLAATAPISGSAAIADGKDPDGGHALLLLSAPAGAAQVRVSTPNGHSKTISVGAGRSVAADITATLRLAGGNQPFVVTPLGTAPVYGVRVLTFSGAHGALITGEPLVGLPAPIPLPPVREDPRVATGQ
jgi:Family of unknown function (DUF5719)